MESVPSIIWISTVLINNDCYRMSSAPVGTNGRFSSSFYFLIFWFIKLDVQSMTMRHALINLVKTTLFQKHVDQVSIYVSVVNSWVYIRDPTWDGCIKEFIKRKWSSGLFWAVRAAEKKNLPTAISIWGGFFNFLWAIFLFLIILASALKNSTA